MPVRDRPECVGTTHSALIGHCTASSTRATARSSEMDDPSVCRYVYCCHTHTLQLTTKRTSPDGGATGPLRSRRSRGAWVLRSSVTTSHATSVATTRSYTCRAGPQSARSATHKGHPCIAVGRPGATRLHIQNPSNPRRIRPVAHAAPTAYAPPLPMPPPGPPHCRLTEVATCGGARPSDGPQTVLAPVAVSFCQNWCVSSMTLMVYSLPTAFSFNPKEFCGLPSMTL